MARYQNGNQQSTSSILCRAHKRAHIHNKMNVKLNVKRISYFHLMSDDIKHVFGSSPNISQFSSQWISLETVSLQD